MPKNRKLRVFLCHATKDKSFVYAIFKKLQNEGWIDPWLDKEKLLPGQNWDRAIKKEVETTDVVIAFLSNNSVAKEGYLQKELRFALDIANSKPEGILYIIPVRISDCFVPDSFRQWQYVDLFSTDTPETQDQAYQKLLESLSLKARELKVHQETKTYTTNHPIEFRKQILSHVFDCIKSAESCYLIGTDTMGKAEALDHMLRKDVQAYYLKEKTDHTLIFRLDMNLSSDLSAWGFYELVLHHIIHAINIQATKKKSKDLGQLSNHLFQDFYQSIHEQANNTTSSESLRALKALRALELAITDLLVRDDNISICFLLDEFDDAYSVLPTTVFSQLRGIRDMNKYRLCYILSLRKPPTDIRPNRKEHERFYELFSRNKISIVPYTEQDTEIILHQLENLYKQPIHELTRKKIYQLSGGHPGLIQIIFSHLLKTTETDPRLQDIFWLAKQDNIQKECLKLLENLNEEERADIIKLARENREDLSSQSLKALHNKGLILENEQNQVIFSPVFEEFLKNC